MAAPHDDVDGEEDEGAQIILGQPKPAALASKPSPRLHADYAGVLPGVPIVSGVSERCGKWFAKNFH